MILYPAIDLKDGKCVRLLQGDMDKATVFNDSPVEQAKAFWDAGCEWLHVVDLNGAFEGWPVNSEAVDAILKACPKMKIQLGGGIRDIGTIQHWIGAGISRVILGTVAAENPEIVRIAAREFPDQIAVGIDVSLGGYVAVRGWETGTDISALHLALEYQDSGVAAIIYTDIEQDGMMEGPNIADTTLVANNVSIPVIASGGVSNMDDLRALKNYAHSTHKDFKTPLNGVIVGRALYDKKIDIKEALALLNE